MNVKKKFIEDIEKIKILANLSNILIRVSPVVFAYTHGSFQNSSKFHDLDVAVYIQEDHLANVDAFRYELSVASQIDLALQNITIDLRFLNTAPLNFRYRVVNTGTLLFSKDESKRIAFVTKTRISFFDFTPHRRLLYNKIVLGKSIE